MENALLIGLSRQAVLQRGLDVIANNIANMNTSGFKADGIVFEEFVMPAARGDGAAMRDRRVSFVADRATWHDLRAGTVEQTGNPLNVAIDGKAFLVVETPRGERYTRNGALAVNAQGELVTGDGRRVLGDAGPIVFQPQDKAIAIGRDGTITVGDVSRGKLRLVEFAQPSRLQKDGAGNFLAPAGVQAQPSTGSRVIQGSLERSNVQSVVEMTRMIDATRTYGTIAQLMQSHGDLRKTALDRLADVPT